MENIFIEYKVGFADALRQFEQINPNQINLFFTRVVRNIINLVIDGMIEIVYGFYL